MLVATIGVYLLVGAPWAAREGWAFAGRPRPLLGAALLAGAVGLLWLDARRAARERPTVVLYTRELCTLCDEARAVLAKLADEAGYAVWEEDVDRDPELAARWGDKVPAATLGDEVLFELRVDAATLRDRLAARRR